MTFTDRQFYHLRLGAESELPRASARFIFTDGDANSAYGKARVKKVTFRGVRDLKVRTAAGSFFDAHILAYMIR